MPFTVCLSILSLSVLLAGPVFLTKPKIECIWHHESRQNFKCIAMDAVSSVASSFSGSGYNSKYQNVLHYLHIALFCFVYSGGNSQNPGDPQHKVYSIDIGGDELERRQMEVRNTTDLSRHLFVLFI